MPEPTRGVAVGTVDDAPAVVDLLLDAFVGDPFFRTIWPDDADYRTMGRRWFEVDVRQLADRAVFWLAEDGSGVACAVPPGRDIAAPGDYAELETVLATAGARAAGAMAVLQAADALGRDGDRWDLVYVAVRPDRQGQGIGRTLVAPMLAAADTSRHAVQLSSTNPRNLPFYARLGFEPLACLRPRPHLPPIWAMWREPRSSA